MTGLSDVLYENLNFEKAEEYFEGKIPVDSKVFYKIADEYKTKAFTVARYSSAEILRKFMDAVQNAIKIGTTIKDFKNEMNMFLENKGYSGMTPYQADNIFRTNIQTAYSVGHYTAMTDETVKKLRPYWQYDAVDDARTRPTHRAMDGKVYAADDPIWDVWYPPNGFRCRCGITTLSKRQLEQSGLAVETVAPKYAPADDFEKTGELVPAKPDKNFGYNPATKAFEPDINNYPEPLKKAYESYIKTVN